MTLTEFLFVEQLISLMKINLQEAILDDLDWVYNELPQNRNSPSELTDANFKTRALAILWYFVNKNWGNTDTEALTFLYGNAPLAAKMNYIVDAPGFNKADYAKYLQEVITKTKQKKTYEIYSKIYRFFDNVHRHRLVTDTGYDSKGCSTAYC
jgi:hypothetical protein